LLDESVFLNESFEWTIQWQIHFLTVSCRHLVELDVIDTTVIWRAKFVSKGSLLYFDRYRRHRCLNTNLKLISQYFCDNVNICSTEITNVWFKTALSGSGSTNTDLNVPVWFCQRFNRRGRIVVINKVGSRGCLNRDRDLFYD